MPVFRLTLIMTVVFGLIGATQSIMAQNSTSLYKDASQPIEKRIEDLLGRMTLEEKIGQMNMPWVHMIAQDQPVAVKLDACKEFARGTYAPGIGPGGGFFTMANEMLPVSRREQAAYFNELQKIAVEQTRLGIPLLQSEEGTHGLMCSWGTVFPEGPAIGSTFDMDLVQEIYTVAAREGRGVGIHQLFTLVVEPIRDPRLGRNQEAYTEDPYLTACIAEAIVRGVQGNDVSAPDKTVAGLCHYPGQSEPVGGLEKGAMEISERKLREVYMPAWVAGIKKMGALGVMATYPSIDGQPVHGSKKILTDILRHELGFDGLVLGEGSGIMSLLWEKVAATQQEAGIMALNAGVDVGITWEDAYLKPLSDAVREEKISMVMVDRAVGRILRQKFRLGLFERPYVDQDHAERTGNTPEHQALALKTAHESIVLLKNANNLLPLRKNQLKAIAVIGPNADHARNQLGDYIPNTVTQEVVTVLEGIRRKVAGAVTIDFVKGCEVLGEDFNEIKKAVAAAKKADVAIIVVGENERQAADGKGTNGEGNDVSRLELTGLQEELIRSVHATGTPTIVILINGRPIAAPWLEAHVPAILEAWNCGERGGEAVADILFGDVNPGGRLSVSVPRHAGQLPVYYNHMPTKERAMRRRGYVDGTAAPLYPFGFGLSYTTFDYSNLRISPETIGIAGNVDISVDVKNSGARAGKEVVQLYLDDVISSMTTPVKELKGFRKIALEPGETKTVTFTVTADQLEFLDYNLQPVVEPGEFKVMIGASSQDIRLTGSFMVIDPYGE